MFAFNFVSHLSSTYSRALHVYLPTDSDLVGLVLIFGRHDDRVIFVSGIMTGGRKVIPISFLPPPLPCRDPLVSIDQPLYAMGLTNSSKVLIFVTGNANKLKEAKAILSAGNNPIEIESRSLDSKSYHTFEDLTHKKTRFL